MITLSFWKRTSHGDGGSPSVHESSGSGSVDVSTVKSPNNTNPDSPGCKMFRENNAKLMIKSLAEMAWNASDQCSELMLKIKSNLLTMIIIIVVCKID